MIDSKERTLRRASIAVGAILVLSIAAIACMAAANPPYRLLSQNLKYFSCSSGNHWAMSSRDEAVAFLDELGKKCSRQPDAETAKLAFLRDLDRAGVDFDRESVVLVQKVYGSGMINARLVFDLDAKGTLRADVQSIVPKGPLTPDIAVRKFAFAVDRTKVSKVAVLIDGQEVASIDLP